MQRYTPDFLSRVETAIRFHRLKPSEFGRAAVGDPGFVRELRRGRSPSLATADRVLAYIESLGAVPRAASERAR
ncbi:hypothetical protein [Elioraea tepidiphila]|jgi:hypothetical protein|uniref:hypothetical protein n=1 Tax=Elioraea tepidiphila TaxID=457934 RepID=UPI000380277B|nr:hypothetical protein [Elioraea tepidiphila]